MIKENKKRRSRRYRFEKNWSDGIEISKASKKIQKIKYRKREKRKSNENWSKNLKIWGES